MKTLTTNDVIASMLTENTGRHFLDSGDAYGRHWERNAGMTVEDWDAIPAASLDRWGCFNLSTYHYLKERIEFAPDLDSMFQEFYAASEDSGYAASGEWLASLDIEELHSFNSYNGEDFLSQVIQGTTFRYGDYSDVYVILQTHNGADVRGGYSTPRVFAVTCDMADYFPYDNADAEIGCTNCEWGYTVRCGGVELIDREGSFISGRELDLGSLFPTVDDVRATQPQCPDCASQVVVSPPYCS